jgi:ATP/maltotriose-dependent transcriptional regulator MalT
VTAPGALPARPTWYVGRAGISLALDATADGAAWLVTVVAGAGAGKTTALGAWATARGARWYSLRPEDAELSVVVAWLAESADIPGWSDALPAELPAAPGGEGAEQSRADALASLLAIAVDHAQPTGGVRPVTAVLDGFEVLPSESPTVRFVEALARHAPPGLRVVVASRNPMPFAVDRLRETGRLAELVATDLVFDVDETFQLLTVALGDAAAADEVAADLHTLTSGWPGQVSLGAAWLAQQPPGVRRARLAAFAGFDAELSDAVLAGTDAPTRALVRAAAYLPRVDAKLMLDVQQDRAGNSSVPKPADLAAAEALLVSAAPLLMPESGRPGWYEVSGAARTGVLAKDPLPADHRRALLRSAVLSYLRRDDRPSAIAAGVDLGEPGRLVDLLSRYGAELIMSGRISDVMAAVSAIPPAARTPAVKLVEAEARHSLGDVPAALACLADVEASGMASTAAIARRVGKIRQLAGDIAGAGEVYARVVRDGSQPIDEAILVGQQATVQWLRGDIEAARAVVIEGLAMAEKCGDERALAAAYATAAMIAERDGDFAANDAYTSKASEAATAAGDMVQLIRIRINRSQRLIGSGRYGDALVELDEAIRLTHVTGTDGWFGAVARTNRGWAFRGLGRYDEALAAFDTARERWQSVGSDLAAYALIGLGATHLDRGDVELADAELTEAITIGDRSGDHQALTGLATLSRARWAVDHASARQLLDRSLATAPGIWRSWALLTLGWIALEEGDRRLAMEQVGATLANAKRFADPCALAEAAELEALATDDDTTAVRILADAQRQWAMLGNPVFVNRNAVVLAHRSGASIAAAEARLRAVGVRPAAALAAGPLRVVGAFRDVSSDADQARLVRAAADAVVRYRADGDAAPARNTLSDLIAQLIGPPADPDLRELYLVAVATLARACEVTGDVEAALAWHLRVLEDAPYDENGHLGVVTTLVRAGRHSEARSRYLMYTERMRSRGVEPAPYPFD